MKRTLTALAASGFLALMAGPALAGEGCGHWGAQSVRAPTTGQDQVVQDGQSHPAPTQTASTEEKSE